MAYRVVIRDNQANVELLPGEPVPAPYPPGNLRVFLTQYIGQFENTPDEVEENPYFVAGRFTIDDANRLSAQLQTYMWNTRAGRRMPVNPPPPNIIYDEPHDDEVFPIQPGAAAVMQPVAAAPRGLAKRTDRDEDEDQMSKRGRHEYGGKRRRSRRRRSRKSKKYMSRKYK
jgi:hypothetical protein